MRSFLVDDSRIYYFQTLLGHACMNIGVALRASHNKSPRWGMSYVPNNEILNNSMQYFVPLVV